MSKRCRAKRGMRLAEAFHNPENPVRNGLGPAGKARLPDGYEQGRGRAALRPGFLKRAPVRLKLRGAQI